MAKSPPVDKPPSNRGLDNQGPDKTGRWQEDPSKEKVMVNTEASGGRDQQKVAVFCSSLFSLTESPILKGSH